MFACNAEYKLKSNWKISCAPQACSSAWYDIKMISLLAGVVVLSLIVLPDHPWWPPSMLFNRHPIKWLPPLRPGSSEESTPTAADTPLLSKILSVLGFGPKKVAKRKPSSRGSKKEVERRKLSSWFSRFPLRSWFWCFMNRTAAPHKCNLSSLTSYVWHGFSRRAATSRQF